MSLIGGLTREQLRAQYVDAWEKGKAGKPLSSQETMIYEIIELHDEYKVILDNREHALAFDPDPAAAASNPFLHMGLHLAVREQISIDRPAGIRRLAQDLCNRLGPHAGEHALMKALGETLWEAGSAGQPPDVNRYLEKARALLER